jgi:hypothetical protein
MAHDYPYLQAAITFPQCWEPPHHGFKVVPVDGRGVPSGPSVVVSGTEADALIEAGEPFTLDGWYVWSWAPLIYGAI